MEIESTYSAIISVSSISTIDLIMPLRYFLMLDLWFSVILSFAMFSCFSILFDNFVLNFKFDYLI